MEPSALMLPDILLFSNSNSTDIALGMDIAGAAWGGGEYYYRVAEREAEEARCANYY